MISLFSSTCTQMRIMLLGMRYEGTSVPLAGLRGGAG